MYFSLPESYFVNIFKEDVTQIINDDILFNYRVSKEETKDIWEVIDEEYAKGEVQ